MIEYFSTYSQVDYARAGTTATREFTIPAETVYSRGGEIPADQDVPLAHSLEQTVRSLGMPTRLVKGRVVLDKPYVVCKYGDTLNSHQTRLLKLFGVATAEFRVRLIA
jgi:mRNA turnover protein 4